MTIERIGGKTLKSQMLAKVKSIVQDIPTLPSITVVISKKQEKTHQAITSNLFLF